LVDYLAERGITCHFFTNGTLLTPQRSDAILQRSNIISLTISCDGAKKTEFEKLRLGANFEDWTQSVRSFAQRAKGERPTLRIGMNTVISQQNINELEDIIHLASELGMHGVHFLEPIPVDEITAASIPSESELTSINFRELYELGRSLCWAYHGIFIGGLLFSRGFSAVYIHGTPCLSVRTGISSHVRHSLAQIKRP
jgi:MoaA/NifB/PqqE/SkfB family radical SAM enzyme